MLAFSTSPTDFAPLVSSRFFDVVMPGSLVDLVRRASDSELRSIFMAYEAPVPTHFIRGVRRLFELPEIRERAPKYRLPGEDVDLLMESDLYLAIQGFVQERFAYVESLSRKLLSSVFLEIIHATQWGTTASRPKRYLLALWGGLKTGGNLTIEGLRSVGHIVIDTTSELGHHFRRLVERYGHAKRTYFREHIRTYTAEEAGASGLHFLFAVAGSLPNPIPDPVTFLAVNGVLFLVNGVAGLAHHAYGRSWELGWEMRKVLGDHGVDSAANAVTGSQIADWIWADPWNRIRVEQIYGPSNLRTSLGRAIGGWSPNLPSGGVKDGITKVRLGSGPRYYLAP